MGDQESHDARHPSPLLLIVGLWKSNYDRSCGSHECCGKFLRPGMVVKFNLIDFPAKFGKLENSMEVWCSNIPDGRLPLPPSY